MADTVLSDASIALVRAANLPISLAAVEQIVAEEDSSENYYNKHYEDPEWPGGSSGVTILLGYDLGYATKAKVIHDLQGKIPDDMLAACLSVTGLTGARAAAALASVKNKIKIPFTVALDVFLRNDMPEWIATVRHYLPNTELLSPDCLGVLVGLSYNRGASFNNTGDRYREMRNIKADMVAKNFADIPNQLRAMSRLWSPTSGVYKRRFHEATLFEQGLRAMSQQPTITTARVGTTTAALNVRAGAGVNFAVKRVVPASTKITVIGETMNGSDKWFAIDDGWVSARYVAVI